MGIKRLAIFGDSELVIRQTMGSYSTKELPYHWHVIKMAKEFKDIAFQHIPQSRNDFADTLAILESLIHVSKGKTISVIEFTV